MLDARDLFDCTIHLNGSTKNRLAQNLPIEEIVTFESALKHNAESGKVSTKEKRSIYYLHVAERPTRNRTTDKARLSFVKTVLQMPRMKKEKKTLD